MTSYRCYLIDTRCCEHGLFTINRCFKYRCSATYFYIISQYFRFLNEMTYSYKWAIYLLILSYVWTFSNNAVFIVKIFMTFDKKLLGLHATSSRSNVSFLMGGIKWYIKYDVSYVNDLKLLFMENLNQTSVSYSGRSNYLYRVS